MRLKCLLCNRRPHFAAVYVPGPAGQARLHAPPGKVRTIVYCLCRKCQRKQGAFERVEAKLLRQVGEALAFGSN